MLILFVIMLVISQILGAPMALLGYATSPFVTAFQRVVAAFEHERPLRIWSAVLLVMLGWSLGVTYYNGGPFFQPRVEDTPRSYSLEPDRPLQTRQAVISCCCSPAAEAAEEASNDRLTEQARLLLALDERLVARHGVHVLSRKEITLTLSRTGRRSHLSEAYDSFCNRCPAPMLSFSEDAHSLLVALTHGSVTLPPREQP